jgi:hypothetical protein
MIFITGEFYGMKVKIVDSYKFISAKLEDLPKNFKFKDLEKEVMPYDIFNNANMFGFLTMLPFAYDNEGGKKVPIEVVKSIELGKCNWNKKKQMQFESNLEKWNCISERSSNRRFTESFIVIGAAYCCTEIKIKFFY